MTAVPRWRLVVMTVVMVFLLLAGWRILSLMLADAAFAQGDVSRALVWRHDHPGALLALAESRLTSGDPEAAMLAARRILQVEPAKGQAFRVLAQVAASRGDRDRARRLFGIAVRLAPNDLPSRAWLAQDALENGRRADALAQIDRVLTLSPGAGANIYPILLTLSADPAFAEALADVMRRPPSWRAGMLSVLQRPSEGDRAGADLVLAALQRKGGFDEVERAAWIEALLVEGRWGEAYARWAVPFVEGGASLPLLYNGDFAHEPSGSGFDWRMPSTAGVIASFEPESTGGRSLHVRFLGRRVAGAIIEHRLWLAPGTYRLRYRARSDALRSDAGLAWTVACEGKSGSLAVGDPMGGSRNWREMEFAFTVPASDCPGQWLRLGSPTGIQSGQMLGGDLWLGGMTVMGVQQVVAGARDGVAPSP